MPRGGHNAKPTELKVIQGTFRSDRATDEPKPAPIAPQCPPGLDATARRIWGSLAPRLEKLGLLTEIDGHVFALLCEAGSRYTKARRRLDVVLSQGKRAKYYSTDLLVTIRRAEVSVEKAEHSFRILADEFGLTPAARSRLDVELGPELDELEEHLNRGKQRRAQPT